MTNKVLVSIIATVALAGCGKKDGGAAKATCKDVEAATRRLYGDRVADLPPGGFEQVCKEKRFDQARIDCIVAAKSPNDLTYCTDPSKPRPTAAGTSDQLVKKTLPRFKVTLMAPDRASIEERDSNAHVGDGTFKLNLFVVDDFSAKSAADKKASLQKELGFEKFTLDQADKSTWHLEYALAGGLAGVTLRLDVGGRALDCGVHKVKPEIVAQVAAACASVQPL